MLTRFSSWAKQNQPAQITLAAVDRRPEHMMNLPMMLVSVAETCY